MKEEAKLKKDIPDKTDDEQASILPSENGELFLTTTGFPGTYEHSKPARALYNIQGKIGIVLKAITPLFLNDKTFNPTQQIIHLSFLNAPTLGAITFTPEDVKILSEGLRVTQSLTSLDLDSLITTEGTTEEILGALRFNNSVIKLRLPNWGSQFSIRMQRLLEQKRLVTLNNLALQTDETMASAFSTIRNSNLIDLSMILVSVPNPKENAEIQAATAVSSLSGDSKTLNAENTLCSLKIHFEMFCGRGTQIPSTVMNDIARFTNISRLVLSGNNDRFYNFNKALEALSTLRLQELTLCYFKIMYHDPSDPLNEPLNEFDSLINVLPTWADSLTMLSLTKIGACVTESESIKFINTLRTLTHLNVLTIASYIFGNEPGHVSYEGYRALAILLQDKHCPPLTSLTIEYGHYPESMGVTIKQIIDPVIQKNPNLSFFENRGRNAPPPSAPIALRLAYNKMHRLDWAKVAVGVAFKRANVGNALCDSFIPLLHSPALPDIPRLADFDAPIKTANTFLPSGGPTKKNTVGTAIAAAAATETEHLAGEVHTKMSSNGL